jgi:hypothetical protein
MKLILSPREVYGKLLYYPINKLAVDLADFKNSKTFSKEEAHRLRLMGFEVIIRSDFL